MIVLLMGVAGAGKTTVGVELSRILGWPLVDADALHSPENIAKMRAGIPLNDADRKQWLDDISQRIRRCLDDRQDCIFACSALKESYRRVLLISPEVRLVYLAISPELARQRVALRTGHFMPASLVESQFEDLEPPSNALTVDAVAEPHAVAHDILAALGLASA